MTIGAIYNITTGIIQQTINPPLSNKAQIDGLRATGLAQILIPEGKTGSTGMIDLSTAQYVDFAPPGPAIPNVILQYIAAQINAGNLSSSAFHPVTIAEINSNLTAANLTAIQAPVAMLDKAIQ